MLNFGNNQDSKVSIGASIQAQQPRVLFQAGARLLSLLRKYLRPTLPPIQGVPSALSPGIKQLVHEVDLSPLPRAKVMNEWT